MMEPTRPHCERAVSSPPAGADAAEGIKAAVLGVLGLDPADFDWRRSLADLGCDSLTVMDIQFELERRLGVPDLGLAGQLDFDPLRAPLAQLDCHVRSKLRRK